VSCSFIITDQMVISYEQRSNNFLLLDLITFQYACVYIGNGQLYFFSTGRENLLEQTVTS